MQLIQTSVTAVFNSQAVQRGDLIRARYQGWDEARNGLAFRLEPEKLTVLFLPTGGGVSSFYEIGAEEADRGEWEIWWSRDLETVERMEGAGNDA